jgi:(2Fe-2S) ferredoxin
MNDNTELEKVARELGLSNITRHIFLCADQAVPKCCAREESIASWEYLKKRLTELGLSQSGSIARTKANCLRVCRNGPIAVVYPDQVWYHSMTPQALERVIVEHLIDGVPVEDYLIQQTKTPPIGGVSERG